MDTAAGLAAAAQAVRIAQSLRRAGAIDASTQISDLMEKLSDIRLALIDARARQIEAEAELTRLRAAYETPGRLVVGEGGFKFDRTAPDPH